MPRKDTTNNRCNRQTPNSTEIILVHVETIMGKKVESFLIENKADIIAAKAKKPTRTRKEMQQADEPEQAWIADWPVCKYTKTGYTKSGTNREEVVADVTAKIRRMVIAYHLQEWFAVRKAQESLTDAKKC